MDRQTFVLVLGVLCSEVAAVGTMTNEYGWDLGILRWFVTMFVFAPMIFFGATVNYMIIKALLKGSS